MPQKRAESHIHNSQAIAKVQERVPRIMTSLICRISQIVSASSVTALGSLLRQVKGRLKIRWMDRIIEDMRHVNVTPEDALDQAKWRRGFDSTNARTKKDRQILIL
ncbi:RNA-directed DNA polymerase from mobile element jockey-like protein [Labeo rohita]|uniref:RNA-directed DNA polymerase from mobile element jockey-like protein n=1 Tax=Labeo rohita TaxID=84645 RepID=A0A498NGG3_LABRO|nr:RNA-directed DNA polymerase from mobile element jockey-like protein [Labeo rohita]